MKRITLNLDGGTLVLGPLLAATIRDNKAAIAAAQQNDLRADELVELVCTLAHACAVRVDPDLTRATVESLVDLDNAGDVFMACWGVSTPPAVAGEQAAVVSPST
jgi:hypothetical protein